MNRAVVERIMPGLPPRYADAGLRQLPVPVMAPPAGPVEIKAESDGDALIASLEQDSPRSIIRDLVATQTDKVFGVVHLPGCRISLLDGVLTITERDADGRWRVIEREDYSAATPIIGPSYLIDAIQFTGKRALMRMCGMTRDAVAPAKLSWKERAGKGLEEPVIRVSTHKQFVPDKPKYTAVEMSGGALLVVYVLYLIWFGLAQKWGG